MQTVDLIVFSLIALSAVIGLFRGFIREFFGLISWIGAGFAAYFGFDYVHKLSLHYIQNPNIAQYATYIGIFISFLILFSILSSVLSQFIKNSVLSGVDRALGFGFGLCRALLILAIFDVVVVFFQGEDKRPAFFEHSKTVDHIKQLGNHLRSVLPERITQFINEKQKNVSQMNAVSPKKTYEELKKEQEANAQNLAELKPQEDITNGITDAVESILESAPVEKAVDHVVTNLEDAASQKLDDLLSKQQ